MGPPRPAPPPLLSHCFVSSPDSLDIFRDPSQRGTWESYLTALLPSPMVTPPTRSPKEGIIEPQDFSHP